MKKTILAFATTFAALNGYGVGATQEWVRRHVVSALSSVVRQSSATNIEVTASVPASLFANGDTNSTYTCTITAGAGTHAALKVVQSSVPEIPAGTFYAMDANGDYVNCSNMLVSTIYAVPYTVQTVATNALGGVSTNSVKMGNFWATDSTNGVWRMGIDGDTILYNSGHRSSYITIRSTTLPERAAAVLIPQQTARLSVRELFSLVLPTAHAAQTTTETVYTVNSETTIAISTITFTRTNRFGKTTTVTFTPSGLNGVYKGPNGPFATKEEANDAVRDLSNWDFGDWSVIMNVEGFGEMTHADLENSDVWRQLLAAIGTERVEVIVKTPDMPAHPCPAPGNIWILDEEANEWKPNQAYCTDDGWDTDALDQWRGEHDCKCGVEGCSSFGVSKHKEGRVRYQNGQLVTTIDEDTVTGCKCCVRCVEYNANPMKTLEEYNDHLPAGEGCGYCGCACKLYTVANRDKWPLELHNNPRRTATWPNLDYSCMCYCSRSKVARGNSDELITHLKRAGDSPWCENICVCCGMVEYDETYTPDTMYGFGKRLVKLRLADWNDHTPRSEATAGVVSALVDPTYYDRCGCCCQTFDTANGGVLPKDFGTFHQMKNAAKSCSCTCGQVHTKDYAGEDSQPAVFPCPEICGVCLKVEDKESNQTITMTIAGEVRKYQRLVMKDPDEEKYHEPDGTECGCKCYNGTHGGASSRHTWSVGAGAQDILTLDGFVPKFHKVSDDGCACRCGQLNHQATGEHRLMWSIAHQDWYAVCDCPGICDVCHMKAILGKDATAADHEPDPNNCGCLCGYFTAANQREIKLHNLARDATVPCFCKCRAMHPGYSQRHRCAICANCGMSASGEAPDDETLHVLKRNVTDGAGNRICRCDCGYFSSETSVVPDVTNTTFVAVSHIQSDGGNLHDYDATDVARGVQNCLCVCGARHEFRKPTTEWRNSHPYDYCDGICLFCRERKENGLAALEQDHTPKHSTAHLCGCRCGFWGIDPENGYGLHEATTKKLHIQSHSDGASGNPAWCQCWGSGSGGTWHWHHPFASTSCSAVCQDLRPSDASFGHLAAGDPSPNAIGFREATPENHKHKTYGCGCVCGMCVATGAGANIGMAYLSEKDKDLHRPPQYGNLCDCECGKYKAVAKGLGTIGGHAFPVTDSVAAPICICTCTNTHRVISGQVNACGYCAKCGFVWREGKRFDATLRSSHLWTKGGCYCDGGCQINGDKMLHEDGHVYAANSCTCNCGEESVDHIAQSTSRTISRTACSRCGAIFTVTELSVSCARCSANIGPSSYVYCGKHKNNCGTPNSPRPGCSVCGCHCTGKCSGHYCSACCTSAPNKRPKRPTPNDPTIPPPCNHNNTGRDEYTATASWECDICGHTLSSTTKDYYCLNCGALVDSITTTSGTHGEHPDDPSSGGGDPDDPNACEYCGRTGDVHAEDCPYYQPTGSGNSGGGNLDDI